MEDFDFDFLDGIGEGAFHSDEENRLDGDDVCPTDLVIEELEQIEREEVESWNMAKLCMSSDSPSNGWDVHPIDFRKGSL